MPHLPPAPGPASLIEGVAEEAAARLGVGKLTHRSAPPRLEPSEAVAFVDAIHAIIAANYLRGAASANKDLSRENWRWQSLQPRISDHNRSPEVVVERAIAAACARLGRTDWANQVPVASGLLGSTRDRRRAIDLVRQRDKSHFELIELKIASDTPLHAAVEILSYACLWLIARNDRPARPSVLLDADHMDLRVLAPAAYYGRFPLRDIESALDAGARALGERHGVTLTFAFDLLDDQIRPADIPDDATLLALLDRPRSATAPAP